MANDHQLGSVANAHSAGGTSQPAAAHAEPTTSTLIVEVAARVRLVTRRRLLADLLQVAISARGVRTGSTEVVLFDGDLLSDDTVGQLVTDTRTGGDAVAVVFCNAAPLAAARWIELGASAVLTHESTGDELVDMIERLSRGEVLLGVAVREGLLSQLRSHRQAQLERDQVFLSLTRREREVLAALAMGSSPEEIARSSYVSMNTVRTQIRNVLAKLNVASVAAAVAMAHRSRWLDDPIRS